nr:hypothetical protein CFP56_64004 [Quercus suber]
MIFMGDYNLPALRSLILEDTARLTDGGQCAIDGNQYTTLWGVAYISKLAESYKNLGIRPNADLLITSDFLACREVKIIGRTARFRAFTLVPSHRPLLTEGPVRMCVYEIPDRLCGITVASRDRTLAVHLHTGDSKADKRFYKSFDGRYAILQYLSLGTHETIERIAIRHLKGVPPRFNLPNIAFSTNKGRRFISGRYVGVRKWHMYGFANLGSEKPGYLCINEDAR